MNTHTPQRRKPKAFSLVEVLAAVAIIGVITFLAIPNIIRVKQDGEDNLARGRAEALNMAIGSYMQANGAAAAQTSWTSAGSDSSRYTLLTPYLAFAETTLAGYMPNGYSATFPTTINPLSTKVTVTGPRGAVDY